MSNEKHLLNSKKDWLNLKKSYRQIEFNDCDFREQPEKFPCICIVTQLDYCKGPLDLKAYYQIDTFVYLADFKQ